MKKIGIVLLFLSLAWLVCSQTGRRGGKGNQQEKEEPGFFESILNLLFPGAAGTSIFQRILNKLSWYVSGILTLIGSYFMFFRKNKQRNEKIIQFLGQWKEKVVLKDAPTDKSKGVKIIHELNFKKNLKIGLKSNSGTVSFNIQLEVNKAEEDSDNLYEINMSGSDPQGKSTLEGFASFQEDKMEMALALTHHKHQRKEESPVYYFEGLQKSQSEYVIEGEWWVEGQQGTSGDYCGNWTFQF